jgi:hypothetical protein
MATVASVYSVAPHERSPESIMGLEEKTKVEALPRARNKRVFASVKKDAMAVCEEAFQEADLSIVFEESDQEEEELEPAAPLCSAEAPPSPPLAAASLRLVANSALCLTPYAFLESGDGERLTASELTITRSPSTPLSLAPGCQALASRV